MDNIKKTHSKPSYEQLEKELEEIQKELITEKKRIAEGEKRCESLYKNAPLPYHSLNIDGYFIEVNTAWLSTMGYSQEDVIGKYYGDFLHPDWKERFKNKFSFFKDAGYVHTHFKIRHKRGYYLDIDLNGNIVYNLDGSFKQTNCVFQDITELKRTKNELEKSESIHRKMISNIGDIVIIFDKDGINRYKSENVKKHFGWEAGDSLGKCIWDKVHPDDLEETKALVFSLADIPNHSITTELRYLCANGEYRWIQMTLLNLLNDPEIEGFLGNYHDISDKKKRENELLLKNIAFDSSISANSTSDTNGVLAYVNKAFLDLCDYDSNDEVVGKHLSKFIKHDHDVKRIINALNNTGHWSGEYTAIKKDGAELIVLANASTLKDINNNFIGYHFSAVNITQRKQNEKELTRYKELLDETGRLSKTGGWELDVKSMKSYFTKETFQIHELETSNAPGLAGINYYAPEARPIVKKAVKEAIEQQKPYDIEVPFITARGKHIWVRTLGLVKVENNKTVRIYGVIQDVTERKEAEITLIKAKEQAEESDRLKSAFLSNMSHEIRTPMNGILGFTDLLQSSDISLENQQRYISIIRQSADRLLNTVNDIVEISRIESGEVKMSKVKIEIVKHLENLVTFHKVEAMNKGLLLSIKNEINDRDLVIHTDRTKLDSILTNLIKNSIKYTNEGFIKVGLKLKDGHLIFYSQDSGIGIPKHRQDAIFNRFEQADIEDKQAHQGSGLGLAIVKSYVEMLDGEIWVESEDGKGSTFFVSLPFCPPSEINEEQPQNEKRADLGKKDINVLIVEDDEFSSLHLL